MVVTGSPPPGGLEALRSHAGGDGLLLLLLKPAGCGELTVALRRAAAASAAPLAAGSATAPAAVARTEIAGRTP